MHLFLKKKKNHFCFQDEGISFPEQVMNATPAYCASEYIVHRQKKSWLSMNTTLKHPYRQVEQKNAFHHDRKVYTFT